MILTGGCMSIVTISRQIGSYGDEIAEKVAEKLQYLLVEKSKLHEMAKDLKGDYSKEMEVLSKESKPGFFDVFFNHRSGYYQLMSAMIYDFASRDNIVVKGRGGQFLLRNKPYVINVRIKAPLELRVERVAKSQNLDKDIVVSMVKKSDHSCEEFNRYLYKENVADDSWYDVIFDTAKISQKTIVDFIVNKINQIEKETPMDEDSKHKYRQLALEKRIEIVLMKEMTDSNYLKIKAKPDGHVIISGYLSTDAENVAAEKLIKEIRGVNSIDNKIVVSQYPVKLWH